jgi:hypothetical protein
MYPRIKGMCPQPVNPGESPIRCYAKQIECDKCKGVVCCSEKCKLYRKMDNGILPVLRNHSTINGVCGLYCSQCLEGFDKYVEWCEDIIKVSNAVRLIIPVSQLSDIVFVYL